MVLPVATHPTLMPSFLPLSIYPLTSSLPSPQKVDPRALLAFTKIVFISGL